MKRVLLATTAIGAASLMLLQFGDFGFGQVRGNKKQAQPRAPYAHTVVFYLKKDAPKGAAAKVIRDCHKLLAKIPSVRTLRAGRPAKEATPGDVTVKDYHVGLMILFDDAKGLQTYLTHKKHVEFVNRYKTYFSKVLVYDFANQAK